MVAKSFDLTYIEKDYDRQDATLQKKNRKLIKIIKDKLRFQQDHINDYHDTFDTLYRASEQVRFQQKYQATEQAKIAAEVHKQEIEEIKKKQQKVSSLKIPNRI